MSDDMNANPEPEVPEVPPAAAAPEAAPATEATADEGPAGGAPGGEGPTTEVGESPSAAAPVPPPPPPPPPPPSATPVEAVPYEQPASDSGKVFAVLGYIFPIVALVALAIDPYKQEPFVRLHAIQAIALWVGGLLAWIPVIGWLLGLALFVVAVIAAIKAFQGDYYRIPFVYDLVKSFIEQ